MPAFSWVSDITNPEIYISPAPGNTQSMLRRGRVVVVEHTCESAQTLASIFSHAIESHSVYISQQFQYERY